MQVTALQAELRRLTSTVGDLARRSDRPTVVQVGGKQGWTVIVYPAVVGGAVLFLYCRITGTSVWDLLYVSRSSLTAFRTTVQESMTKVWEEMKKQKEEIFKVVAAMGRKQDELKDNQDALMAKQDQMDERLRRVRLVGRGRQQGPARVATGRRGPGVRHALTWTISTLERRGRGCSSSSSSTCCRSGCRGHKAVLPLPVRLVGLVQRAVRCSDCRQGTVTRARLPPAGVCGGAGGERPGVEPASRVERCCSTSTRRRRDDAWCQPAPPLRASRD